MNFIDAHVHVWTPDTDRYPLAAGFKKENMKPASFTPEELFKHCKPAGVGRVNLIQMSFYGFDNSYMLDTIAKYPDVFVGTAVINPHGKDPESEMKDLAKKGVCVPFVSIRSSPKSRCGEVAASGRIQEDVRRRRPQQPGPVLSDRT